MEWLTHFCRQVWQCLAYYIKHNKAHLNSCLLCKNPSNSPLSLCRYCQDDLPKFSDCNENIDQHIEENLLTWPAIAEHISHQHFDRLICFSPYLWPVNMWLLQLKYQRYFEHANLLAELLNKKLQQFLSPIELQQSTLVSVPLHITRWQERGFNQSHLLANKLSQLSNIPYQPHLLQRTVATDHQVGKSGVLRRKNIKNAFAINPTVFNTKPHIILLDDVITTGTTVNEIARLLKRSGAEQITVITLAMSLKNID